MRFRVFKQLTPELIPGSEPKENRANFQPCGTVEAKDGDEALAITRKWPLFANEPKKKLAAWPVVQAEVATAD